MFALCMLEFSNEKKIKMMGTIKLALGFLKLRLRDEDENVLQHLRVFNFLMFKSTQKGFPFLEC